MPKKRTISSAKKNAWTWFSKYIRLRDCLVTTGSKTRGKCYTCDRSYPFEELQAGHAMDGRNASILFDENLVHAQCYGCNIGKSGNKEVYIPKMIKKWGMSGWEKFMAQKRETHKWSVDELDGIAKEYREEFNMIKDLN